jgi:uncharacterized protein (DUF427 family)
VAHHDPQWRLRDGYREGEWQIRGEISPRWIRVKFGGETVADSKRALVVTETGKLPAYYFPLSEVRTDLLEETDYRKENENKGEAVYWTLKAGGRTAEKAVWGYVSPPPQSAILKGYVTFKWDAMDAWYEEEEEVFVHARDPYTRVDAIPASRHIQVVVGGRIVADSRRPVIVYETGLTPRYYLPREDVCTDYFVPSDTVTRCPYKGKASYWSVRVDGKTYPDLVWSYEDPLAEVHEIAGKVCFYNEKVDAIYVDGAKWQLGSKERVNYGKAALATS